MPYDTWNFSFPINSGEQTVGGVAFDPATGRVYVSLIDTDHEAAYSELPLIEVFQVNVPSGTQAPLLPRSGRWPPRRPPSPPARSRPVPRPP